MHFESGLLSVEAIGDFSLENAKQAFLGILEAVTHHKAGENIVRWPERDRKARGHGALLLWRIRSKRNPEDCR